MKLPDKVIVLIAIFLITYFVVSSMVSLAIHFSHVSISDELWVRGVMIVNGIDGAIVEVYDQYDNEDHTIKMVTIDCGQYCTRHLSIDENGTIVGRRDYLRT